MRAYGMQSGSGDYAELLASVRRAKPLGIALTKPLNLYLHSLNLCRQRRLRRAACERTACLHASVRHAERERRLYAELNLWASH
jgi:hypothetical protein